MKKLVFIFITLVALSFASCGNGTGAQQQTAADSIRLQDSIDAVKQAEQEALEVQQAEKAAEIAAQAAAEKAAKK